MAAAKSIALHSLYRHMPSPGLELTVEADAIQSNMVNFMNKISRELLSYLHYILTFFFNYII